MNKKMSASPQRIYQFARYALLGIIGFTIVNILLFYMESESYYVSSVFSSYFMVLLFDAFPALLFAAVILIPFVLAFIFSKRSPVWMIIALVLIALDLIFLVYICVSFDVLLYRILDILVHIFEVIIFIVAIIYSKRATAEINVPQTDAGASAAPVPASVSAPAAGYQTISNTVSQEENLQKTVQNTSEGAFTDVVCMVSVSQDGKRHTLEAEGIARFYENELALGVNGSLVKTMLIGTAFSKSTEMMRFPYSDITRIYYARKNQRTVRIDLRDGRYAFLIVNSYSREQLTALLAVHGLVIEPFDK